jgi:hypothetical protein
VKKEIRKLLIDCQCFNYYQGIIFTFDEEELFESKGVNLKAVPFYKFFGGYNNKIIAI